MPELGCSGTPPLACGAACTGPRTHLLGGPLAEGGTGHGSACATAAARPFGCGRHGSDRAPWLPPAAWVLGHRGLRRPQEAPGISHCPQCGVLAATSPGPGGPGCPTPPGVSPPTASRVSAGRDEAAAPPARLTPAGTASLGRRDRKGLAVTSSLSAATQRPTPPPAALACKGPSQLPHVSVARETPSLESRKPHTIKIRETRAHSARNEVTWQSAPTRTPGPQPHPTGESGQTPRDPHTPRSKT